MGNPVKTQGAAELDRDPTGWFVESEERERGRRIARGIADSYTDADWEYVLNALDPARAARKIANRPDKVRGHLLDLLRPEQRSAVESLLSPVI